MTTIKDLREEKRYKQIEMAEQLGMSRSLYNGMEMFKVKGTLVTWLALQKFYELDDGEMWRLYVEHCKMVDEKVGEGQKKK